MTASDLKPNDAHAVLYAVDLDELRQWVGCRDQRRFDEAMQALREDEDSEWEPEELAVLERLLRRLVFEGKLFDGLAEDERYYLSQLLIDLFDEYVDQEALTEDIPLQQLAREADTLPGGSEPAKMLAWLVRGRELGGEQQLWTEGPVQDVLSYLGYLTREECARLPGALDRDLARTRKRPGGIMKQVRSAAEECARAELDLVSFVG